eukprot:gene26362-31847_t
MEDFRQSSEPQKVVLHYCTLHTFLVGSPFSSLSADEDIHLRKLNAHQVFFTRRTHASLGLLQHWSAIKHRDWVVCTSEFSFPTSFTALEEMLDGLTASVRRQLQAISMTGKTTC